MPNANQKTALDTHRTQVSEATSSENSNASFQSNKNKSELRAPFWVARIIFVLPFRRTEIDHPEKN